MLENGPETSRSPKVHRDPLALFAELANLVAEDLDQIRDLALNGNQAIILSIGSLEEKVSLLAEGFDDLLTSSKEEHFRTQQMLGQLLMKREGEEDDFRQLAAQVAENTRNIRIVSSNGHSRS